MSVAEMEAICSGVETKNYAVKKRKLNTEQDLQDLPKSDLINRIKQLESQVDHLKSIIRKQSISKSTQIKIKKSKKEFDFSKCQKQHVALKLLYLGWNYDGFVEQVETINTIEYHLFEALKSCCLIENRETSNYSRCGRTDQGVSSFSQVISLTVRSRVSDNKHEFDYCKMLNAKLPNDIRILAWCPVPDNFTARFSCLSRTYKYWFPRGDLDIIKMDQAVKYMIGDHDFRNICKMDVSNGRVNYKRSILNADVSVCTNNNHLGYPEYDMCVVTIVGQSFLWHQVRCILSVLFLVGKNKEQVDIVQKLLDTETYPKKPQYSMASSLPLNLFHCEFEHVNWISDDSCIKHVAGVLLFHWSEYYIKTVMIEEMIKNCHLQVNKGFVQEPYTRLFKHLMCRKYIPLLSRPTSKTLEDSIEHFMKKGRIELKQSTKLEISNDIK